MITRILLVLATNLAVVGMIAIVLTVLGGVGLAVGPERLPLVPIAATCMTWGVLGACVSLWLYRWLAKRALHVRLLDGNSGDNDLDWLHATASRLARQAGISAPEIGIYESAEVNALTTGRSRRRSLVAVSRGLLRNMSREEIEGVLGHEVAHIANGDMVTMALLQGVLNSFVLFFVRLVTLVLGGRVSERVTRVVTLVTRIGLEFLLGLLGSTLVAWFSRRREFRADAGGAVLAGRPAMRAALTQLVRTRDRIDGSWPALAAFKIAGGYTWFELLSSHPPLERRLAAIEKAQGSR